MRCFNFILVAVLLAFGQAHADYYFHPYYQHQQASPIISLTLDPQESLNSDLRIAARENRVDQMQRVLKEGANVNGLSEEGETALIYASRACSIKAGRFLLSREARINYQDKSGRTALIYAAMSSCSPLVSRLVRIKSIDLHARDKSGMTALDYAREGASLSMQGPPVDDLKMIEIAIKKTMHHSHHLALITSSHKKL